MGGLERLSGLLEGCKVLILRVGLNEASERCGVEESGIERLGNQGRCGDKVISRPNVESGLVRTVAGA